MPMTISLFIKFFLKYFNISASSSTIITWALENFEINLANLTLLYFLSMDSPAE